MPDEECAQQQRCGGADQRIEVEDERQPQTRQCNMRDDVSRQAHSLHQSETSDQAGGYRRQERQDN
jgi:hypothetical protein